MTTRIAFGLTALVSLLLSSTGGRAQLGDSEHQLVSHYGRVTSSEKDPAEKQTLTFERPGRLIIAKLSKGKCVSVTTIAIGEKFNEKQIQGILAENAQGKQWTHPKEGGDLWTRSDGAVAYITAGSVDVVNAASEGIGSPLENTTPTLDLKPAPPVGAVSPATPTGAAGALPPPITSPTSPALATPAPPAAK